MLAGVDPSTTSIGPWCDATWAAYVDFYVSAAAAGGPQVAEGLDDQWAKLTGATSAPTDPATSPQAPAPASPRTPPRFDPPIDPETGQPRRPTKAERDAWALQFAGGNDLLGAGGGAGAGSGAAPKVGG